MSNKYRNLGLLAAILMATAVTVPAMADTMPKQVQMGKVTYVTGGVGVDERKAMEATEKNYNLRITNSDKKGELTADDRLVILGHKGKEMVKVESTDPLIYAKLPSGHYTIEANKGNEQRVRKINVSAKKPVDVHLVW